MVVKKIEPKDPETVFFGLIFDNFGPFNIFPKKYAATSEIIHPISNVKIKVFNCIKLEK
tara:strand:+ start:362 stop:538 length:177 start_codon:yes stop_codon:yes gene_type:complete